MTLKNDTKIYFHCKNQQQCYKKAYIKCRPDKKGDVEIYLSTSDHNHITKTIPAESKEMIVSLFKRNILTYQQVIDNLEKNNLDKISNKQFYNLRERYRSKK